MWTTAADCGTPATFSRSASQTPWKDVVFLTHGSKRLTWRSPTASIVATSRCSTSPLLVMPILPVSVRTGEAVGVGIGCPGRRLGDRRTVDTMDGEVTGAVPASEL